MAKVFIFGDFIPTGFGRILRAAGTHLAQRGHEVMGACIQYDGLLPLGLPFWVSSLQGKDHGRAVTDLVATIKPDVVLVGQDFPYLEMVRFATGIDWSVTAFVGLTPIDGTPVDRRWLTAARSFDALMTISEFGVQALKDAGVRASLCPPGVDMAEFHRLPDDQRAALRDRLMLPREAFVVGMMAMNQGRKDFPGLIEGWWRALKDIPDAFLYLDCDKASPAGWDIPAQLVEALGVDPARIRYREDAVRAGMMGLNERYNLLDLHGVIAHREGYGLPHTEAAATGCPTMANDYCSGREVTGGGAHGLLIKAAPARMGTWGGARDFNADLDDLAAQIRWAYEHPAELRAMSERASQWAKTRPWNAASEAIERAILDALAKRAAPPNVPQPTAPDVVNAGVMIAAGRGQQ
ncbi:MAG: glycosyltransferase family 4 protein [Phycisphaerales bacterium]|jgi:glycosyltransferase involved in cell wall biosynthesis